MKFKVINKILNNRKFDNIDYSVKDALNVLENLKNNPYGIKTTDHLIIRCKDRFVNLDTIYGKLSEEIPVGIEKEMNASSRFLLLYKYSDVKDLGIAIDILNEEEIPIVIVIDKPVNRRRHHGNQ